MKIIVLTENSPLYTPRLIHKLLVQLEETQHQVAAVINFSPYNKGGVLQTIKQRFQYFGVRDFLKATLIIIKQVFLILAAALIPTLRGYSVPQVLKKHTIKNWQISTPNEKSFIGWVRRQEIDLIVSVFCPKIFKSDILRAPRMGCINYHLALLPKYRGRQSLFWALLHNEKQVGASVHEMDEGIDTGPIIKQQAVPVLPGDTLHSLYLKITRLGPQLIVQAIDKLAKGDKERIANDSSENDYFGFPTSLDGRQFRQTGKRFF
jgi:folate-dependent phosphoribosylglycinamide formyltransferase PurN